MKKRISIVIVLIICCVLFSACASSNNSNQDGFMYYLLDDGTYAVSFGTNKYLSEITFPSKHNGKPVTRIVSNQSVFAIPNDYRALKQVVIPDTITHIDDYAFEYCVELTELNLPSSVIYIGEKAFFGCHSLEKLTISSNIEYVGNDAFSNCPVLSCKEYGNGMYLGNDEKPYYILVKAKDINITEVQIHEQTQIICSDAFYNCDNLTDVELPDSVRIIGKGAFSYCDNLKSFSVGEDSLLEIISERMFERCYKLKTVTLPKNLIAIEEDAFFNSGLVNLTIPKTVNYIGRWALNGLKTVKFESTSQWYVTEIKGVKTGIDLDANELQNNDSAIEYLTKTYSSFYWYRK